MSLLCSCLPLETTNYLCFQIEHCWIKTSMHNLILDTNLISRWFQFLHLIEDVVCKTYLLNCFKANTNNTIHNFSPCSLSGDKNSFSICDQNICIYCVGWAGYEDSYYLLICCSNITTSDVVHSTHTIDLGSSIKCLTVDITSQLSSIFSSLSLSYFIFEKYESIVKHW